MATGRWDAQSLRDSVSRVLGCGVPEAGRLTARLLALFDAGRPPRLAELIGFLYHDRFAQALLTATEGRWGGLILLDPPVMHPQPEALVTLPLPQLTCRKELATWLGLFDHELSWFADFAGQQARETRQALHHYRYQWLPKASGGWRLIEQPKPRLKAIQRQILREMLDSIAPHPCAHGFRRGRSSMSYVTPHIGKAAVLRMDLKDFFVSVPTARIAALFRTLGYPQPVAQVLRSLCTHALSPALAATGEHALSWAQRKRLQSKHLPQGAPTSPALANLCAWRLDCRLQGLAEHFGLDYTRYADDLALSGGRELLRLAPFVQGAIGAIAREEGFCVNHRKTRLQSKAQRQHLTGIVINQRPNLDRRAFDRLKATLFNCVRHGPASQNREGRSDFKAHLAGRVAHAGWLNPDKARRLRRLWEQIDWAD